MVRFGNVMTARMNKYASVVVPLGREQVSRCPGRVGRQLNVEVTLNQERGLTLVGHATREGKSRRTGRDDLVLARPLLQTDVVLGDALDRPEFLRSVRRVREDRTEEREREEREKRVDKDTSLLE